MGGPGPSLLVRSAAFGVWERCKTAAAAVGLANALLAAAPPPPLLNYCREGLAPTPAKAHLEAHEAAAAAVPEVAMAAAPEAAAAAAPHAGAQRARQQAQQAGGEGPKQARRQRKPLGQVTNRNGGGGALVRGR